MNDTYFIGKPVLYAIDDNPASIGEIVEIMKENGETRFTVREPANFTEDGWKYNVITKDQVVKINNKYRPDPDPWELEHIDEISKVFGKDMSNFIMIIYDSLEEVDKDFDEYAHDERFCRKVLDKWVFLVG